MEQPPPKFTLIDADGQPLAPHLAGALTGLIPRLVRHYPVLQDESLLLSALESAGQKISSREQQSGPIEKLRGFAWVTLRNCVRSLLRTGKGRLAQKLVDSDGDRTAVDALRATTGTPEQIERAILLREVLSYLTPEERHILIKKIAGHTSEEIAENRGGTAAGVDTLLSRARDRIRPLLSRNVDRERPGKPGRSATRDPGHRASAGPKDGNDDE